MVRYDDYNAVSRMPRRLGMNAAAAAAAFSLSKQSILYNTGSCVTWWRMAGGGGRHEWPSVPGAVCDCVRVAEAEGA